MPTAVTILAGGRRIPIPPLAQGEPPIVPAQHLVIEIEGDAVPGEILVNDEPFPVIRAADGRRGHTLLDRFRSAGFHRFQVDGETFCFGTADAKLELDGILTILRTIGHEGLSWGHQFIFSTGAVIRDPRVDYAWLRTAGREILNACLEIAERPAGEYTVRPRLQRPRGGRARLAETLSKLRADPTALLEEHERGIVMVDGRRFMPRKVVSGSREVTHDTVANRRATRLLLASAALAYDVAKSADLPKRYRQWVEALRGQLNVLLAQFPFSNLIRVADRVPEAESVIEHTDPRYVLTYRLHDELTNELGWEPGLDVSDRFAYVGHSDEIYQAFVAVLLANAFGAERAVPYLRRNLTEPCFRSDRWDIYYDTAPPAPEYTSWRDRSSRPARLTPDYCIIDRRERRGLLGDAKYRSTPDRGRLPSSSLNDCQVYMQHFGVRNFAVFYPGPDRLIDEISGEGNTILEVSVTPFNGVAEWIATEVRPRLEALLEPLEG